MESISALTSALLSIILIDLVLSGDNALVIGMAAHQLPPEQRRLAIVGGAAMAIVLRVGLTVVASYLLRVPYLQLVGGALLLWVAFKLLRQEEEAEATHRAATNLREAILTIVVADAVMSLDNILGVAGAAHGHTGLLLFGLLLSMGLMMFGGSLVATVLNRVPWMAYLAAAVIAWTGADMMLHDPVLHGLLLLSQLAVIAISLSVAAATVGLAHWVHRRPQLSRAAST